MSLDRTTFFAYARRAPFGGRLSTAQVAGCNAILDEWQRRRLEDWRVVAYDLATAFHETGGTMQPVREKGGRSYFMRRYDITGARPDKARELGNIHPGDGAKFPGMGHVQSTGRANARRAGDIIAEVLGRRIDFEKEPERLMEMDISVALLIEGMERGVWTGRRIRQYFLPQGRYSAADAHSTAKAARACVNGRDKADLIARYWKSFLDALKAADQATAQPDDVSRAAAEPDDVPPARSGSVGTVAITTGAGACSALIAGISNPWALAAFALILIAGGVGAWLLLTGRVTINRGKAPAL